MKSSSRVGPFHDSRPTQGPDRPYPSREGNRLTIFVLLWCSTGAWMARKTNQQARFCRNYAHSRFSGFGVLTMPRSDQGATRQEEDSKVLVKWTDSDGNAFTEKTDTRDISETGISFYLETPVWLDTHLTLTIGSSSLFGRLHTTTAKVVRVQTDASGRQVVAARFDE